MKQISMFCVAVCGLASLALATDVNLNIQSSKGLNEIDVAENAPVSWQAIVSLSDDTNEGLALLGFDLRLRSLADGSIIEIPQADTPTTAPTTAFDRPDGLTNPEGFGGTLMPDGRQAQIGGGQNTINNGQLACTTGADCPTGSSCEANLCTPVADFPIGQVILGVAQPAGTGPIAFATGTFTAPSTAGDYVLEAPDGSVFANVIRQGETGEIFYATEAAGVGEVTSLLLHVGGDVPVDLVSSLPACDSTLPGSAGNIIRLEFSGPITAPAPGEILIEQLAAGGGFTGGDLSASFTYSVDSGNTLVIQEDGTVFSDQTWYAIRNTGGWAGVANFKVDLEVAIGDANEDGFVLASDVLLVNASVGCFSDCDPRLDINGDTFILASDVLAANARVGNFGTPKPEGHACP